MRWIFLVLMIGLLVLTGACDGDDSSDEDDDNDDTVDDDTSDDDTTDDDTADDDTPLPELGPAEVIVPSEGLSDEVEKQNAANNLDVAAHDDRVFLAFRTAPSHFASRQATLYVVSSVDGVTWDFEATFHRDTDLREPRLLSLDGTLFLYFAVLGTNPLNFEPQGMMVSRRLGPGEWTEAEWFFEEGFIPWRVKKIGGVPYMLAYVGGEGIYSLDPEPIEVYWLTTDDGVNWSAVVPGQPVVLSGGGSETDFVFLDDGSLVAVSRNEMGDESGFGSSICRAEADALGDWFCVNDPRKYDSPLMFRHHDEVYLIGRRNLNDSGYYDLGYDDLPLPVRHLLYELDYWITPKRTSLWRVDTEDLSVEFVLDFPSRGDTCFPGLIDEGGGVFQVYNYTSPLTGPDTVWLLGQLGPTHIVRTELTFPQL